MKQAQKESALLAKMDMLFLERLIVPTVGMELFQTQRPVTLQEIPIVSVAQVVKAHTQKDQEISANLAATVSRSPLKIAMTATSLEAMAVITNARLSRSTPAQLLSQDLSVRKETAETLF